MTTSEATEPDMSQLANANNSFGFNLFSQFESEHNIVISPSSIASALALNGEQKELAMYVFLSEETSSLAEFNQQLDLNNWQ